MARKLKAHEVRSLFLQYFVKKNQHVYVPSSSVIPRNDTSLLFTNAGMNQFKPIFQGVEEERWKRVANTQKCIRAGGKHNDLSCVGTDVHHHTFFEMLGNWSFGDYFKREICHWAFEFLTKYLDIPANRLYVTYFGGDAATGLPPDLECRDVWLDVGLPAERILSFGMADNFWEMGERGPCGPCSEIHYDRIGGGRDAAALVNTGDSTVVEVWNLVFMQFNRFIMNVEFREDNGLRPLPRRHIDCGLGLERLAAIVQGKTSNYDTDLFQPIFSAIQQATRAPAYAGRIGHEDVGGVDAAYRVVADHLRTLNVALSDGAQPSNVDSGYVLRMILRRAVRTAADRLGASPGQFGALAPVVSESLGDTFPELKHDPHRITTVINAEEKRFWATLKRGRAVFDKSLSLNSDGLVSGELAWKLHDTYGIPIDVTQMMAADRNLRVDMACFTDLRRQASQLTRDAYKRSRTSSN